MSRDIRRILNPGEEQTVNVRGDFIYCKAANVPIHVALGSEVTEMVPGDKLRERQRFTSFKVENRSDDTTVFADFVVGDGDYESQIIRGEVAISPRLLTKDGSLRDDSRHWLSLFIRPDPGFAPGTYRYGDPFNRETVETAPVEGSRGDGEWDPQNERFVFRTNKTGDADWVEFDEGFNLVTEEPAPTRYSHRAAFVLDGGHCFFMAADYGSPDHVYYGDRYGDGSGATAVIEQRPEGGDLTSNDAITRDGDTFYFLSAGDGALYKTTVEKARSGAPEWLTVLTGVGGVGVQNKLQVESGRVHVHDRDSNNVRLYDLETGDQLESFAVLSQTQAFIAARGLLYQVGENETEVNGRWAEEGPHTVNMQAKAEPLQCRAPAGMIDTAAWQFTLADLTATKGLMGQIRVSGEIIRAALALYAGEADAPDDYLDHVYAVKTGGGVGRGQQAVRATQTFAAAGAGDNFNMTIPGAIHLQIDALMFNDE